MDLCGHRGFAGPSACVLEEGHSGKHQYGDIGTAYEVEMRKDAERYRWLRQYGNQEWERVFDEACRNMLEGAALDRAIDAALDETANAPHEWRTAALSPGVPLDAVVGRQNVTTE